MKQWIRSEGNRRELSYGDGKLGYSVCFSPGTNIVETISFRFEGHPMTFYFSSHDGRPAGFYSPPWGNYSRATEFRRWPHPPPLTDVSLQAFEELATELPEYHESLETALNHMRYFTFEYKERIAP